MKKNGLKFQFLCILALEIFLWSLLSEVYWIAAEKILTKGAPIPQDSWTPDLIYVIGAVLVLLLSTIPLILYLFRRINSPVKKITDGIRQISKGKYRHINVKGAAEFVEIAESFNKMSDSLSEMEERKVEIEKERILLFANMAHDLKTPVTSILGYSKALGEGMVEDKEKQKEYLMTMTSKAMRINELIDRLFEYVKIESPENVLHKTDCDVAEILRNCVADIYTDFEEKNIGLELNITEQAVIKNVDSLEIGRVFTNILNNALKHTSGGTKVFVEMDKDGNAVIADTGEKIPENIAANLFKPFVSGDESRKSSNGSGLGLALAYKIMQKHDGSLLYKSPYEGYTKAFLIKF